MRTYYIFETTCNYQVVVVINISIITNIIIIIKRRKQGCSKITFVTQKAPCLKIIIERSPYLWKCLLPRMVFVLNFRNCSTNGMFSLSGTSAKKVIGVQSCTLFSVLATCVYTAPQYVRFIAQNAWTSLIIRQIK